MTSNPIRIRAVADLHTISHWGLVPPNIVLDGEPLPQNKFNQWLWACWVDMCAKFPPADLLIVDGDVIDGEQPKSRGRGVKTTDLDWQQRTAIEVLKPAIAQAKEWVLIKGTEYHEQWFAAIALALKAKVWDNGELVPQVGDIQVGKWKLNVAHHPEGGDVLYLGTKLDRTAKWATMRAHQGKVEDAHLILRAHNHEYACFQGMGRTVIQLPGWQLATPYARKRGYYKYVPDIGFVDIVLREDESYPIVEPVLYQIPMTTTAQIKVGG